MNSEHLHHRVRYRRGRLVRLFLTGLSSCRVKPQRLRRRVKTRNERFFTLVAWLLLLPSSDAKCGTSARSSNNSRKQMWKRVTLACTPVNLRMEGAKVHISVIKSDILKEDLPHYLRRIVTNWLIKMLAHKVLWCLLSKWEVSYAHHVTLCDRYNACLCWPFSRNVAEIEIHPKMLKETHLESLIDLVFANRCVFDEWRDHLPWCQLQIWFQNPNLSPISDFSNILREFSLSEHKAQTEPDLTDCQRLNFNYLQS